MDLSDTPIAARYFTPWERFLCHVSTTIRYVLMAAAVLYYVWLLCFSQ
jgi:hypothetical protein